MERKLHKKNQNHTEIYDVLNKFVRIWESGTGEGLELCVVKEPRLYFGIFENMYERESLKKALQLPVNRPEMCKMEIINETSRISGDKAYQYAALLGHFSNESSQIAFGGSFVNTLIKKEDGWKLETIRFELKSDNASKEIYLTEEGMIKHTQGEGNLKLLTGWKLVNDRVGCFMSAVEGQAEDVICAEYDATWFANSEDGLQISDEKQVKDLWARFCFAYDYSNMFLNNEMLTEDVRLFTTDGKFHRREAIGYLKLKRQSAPRSFHAGKFEKLNIEGGVATAEILSLAPEYFSLKENGQAEYGEKMIYLKAVKTNSGWKIAEMNLR